MNTFFYERLTTNKNGKRGFNYQAIERWTSKVDLLSYDYIVVPINEHAHWYMAIICNAPRFLGPSPEGQESSQSQNDSNLNDEETISPEPADVTPSKKGKRKSHGPPRKYKFDEPRIITLDSLGGKHSPTCSNLKEYLVAEIKSKHGIEIPTPGAIGMTATNIPQQDNYSDCGLFLLNYLEKFLQRPDTFIRAILQNSTDSLAENWCTASETRTRIRDILFDLQAKQRARAEKPKESAEEAGVVSENQPRRPSTPESPSPEETTSISASSEPAIKKPNREQSVTTPTDTSIDGISRLGSLGAGDMDITEEPMSTIHKPARERRPTPFPANRSSNDENEGDAPDSPVTIQHVMEFEDDGLENQVVESGGSADDGAGGRPAGDDGVEASASEVNGTQTSTSEDEVAQEDRREDGEMLLRGEDDRRTTKSSARSPSPALLSDPSFLSVSSSTTSSTTPEQQASKIASSPSNARKPKSPSPAAKPRTDAQRHPYEIDAADRMIVGKLQKLR
jgi:hypothetical protein